MGHHQSSDGHQFLRHSQLIHHLRSLLPGALALFLAAALPALAAASSLTLTSLIAVDRQVGKTRYGEAFEINASVTNTGATTLRFDSSAVKFRDGTTSVDGQYIVTRPAFPFTVSGGATVPVTFFVRPWATVKAPTIITAEITLRGFALGDNSAQSLSAALDFRLAESADLVLGQPNPNIVEGLTNGFTLPSSVSGDGTHLLVCDTQNNRVLIYTPVPTSSATTATVVLGQPGLSTNLPNFDRIGAGTLKGPKSARTDGTRIVVTDTQNNRVLIWNTFPTSNLAAASVVLGQPDFTSSAPNNGGITARGLSGPTDAQIAGGKLIVSDTGNHRVLIWNTIPTSSNTPADVVLGQGLFTSATANYPSGVPGSASLSSPAGVWYDGERLFIADANNNRVLVYPTIPTASFASASFALGQAALNVNLPNRGGAMGAGTMSGPSGVQSDGARLFVADSRNNRVLLFNPVPITSTVNANRAIGQQNLTTQTADCTPSRLRGPTGMFSDGGRLYVADSENNRVGVFEPVPSANNESMDFALGKGFLLNDSTPNDPGAYTNRRFSSVRAAVVTTGQLFVADAACRVLGFNPSPLDNNTPANILVGQSDFPLTLPNGGGGTNPQGFTGPEGIGATTSKLLIADTGNHRISIFDPLPFAPLPQASVFIGQANGTSGSPNRGSSAAGNTLKQPVDVATDGTRLLIADKGNNRILAYNAIPGSSGLAANAVIGQSNATNTTTGVASNRLNGPEGVAVGADGKVFIADTQNHRVLICSTFPTASNTAANFVIGQTNFTSGARDGGTTVSARTLDTPAGVAYDGQRLAVVDTMNHRVLIWDQVPSTNGKAADTVIGQPDFTSSAENLRQNVGPVTLYQPKKATWDAGSLWVSDTGNTRLLRFDFPRLTRVRVSAGNDRLQNTGVNIQLAATASSAGQSITAYRWTQLNGPAATPIGSLSQANVTYSANAPGMHAFSVTVTDSGGITGTSEVHVLVNTPPAAPALPDRAVNPSSSVFLDARGAVDPDGDALTYAWNVSGTDGSSVNLTGITASFTPSPATTYTVDLTVSDGNGGTATDRHLVAVRRNPVVVLFAPTAAGGSQTLTLDASLSSDPDGGALSYQWTQTLGPVVTLNPTAQSAIVTFTSPGADSALGFQLTVMNPNAGQTSQTLSITIDGTAPGATLNFPQGVAATARGQFIIQATFSEPMQATTQTPTITFVRTSGSGSLSPGVLQRRSDDSNFTKFDYAFDASFANNGTYTILLAGKDTLGNSLTAQPSSNSFSVNVPNRAPTAVAVGASTATTGQAVQVDGAASSDPDGDTITYLWTGTRPGGAVSFSNPTSARTTFVPTVAGSHTIQLQVTDQHGVSSSQAAFNVQVQDVSPNTVPVASAGADRLVAAGQLVTLAGTANDADGDALTFRWQLVSKPAGSGLALGNLSNAQGGNTLAPFFTPDVPGAYGFVLTVTDTSSASASSSMRVLVDDHANTVEAASGADAYTSAGGTRPATIEASGDSDVFSFPGATGTIYRISLRCVTVTTAELTLIESDGTTVLQQAAASQGAPAALDDYRPPVAGTRYLRVRSAGTGSYELTVTPSPDSFTRPPGLTLSTRLIAGQLEATVASDGTSVPLSFLQFLTDYDSTALTLVGRTPESAASGFTIDAEQFSLPFIDTLLQATTPRPVPSGALVTLNFQADSRTALDGSPVNILSVTGTPPSPLSRVTVFRPTADAGLPLVLEIEGGKVPDIADEARTPRPFLRLDGRGSRDSNQPPRALTYHWRVVRAPAGATLSQPGSPAPTVSLAGPGTYSFALNVSNGVLSSPTSVVDIRLRGSETPPVAVVRSQGRDAKAGAFLSPVGSTVRLDGSRSTDEDEEHRDSLRYAWTQTAGPAPITLPGAASVSFPSLIEGTYRFQLVVTDDFGLSSEPATVEIVVHDPDDTPTALTLTAFSSLGGGFGGDLGPSPETTDTASLRTQVGAEVTIQARATDPQFSLGQQQGIFFWRQAAGPAVRLAQSDTPPSRSKITFTPVAPSVYEFECRVREANSSGQELGPEVTRFIRVVVDSPGEPIPDANAAVLLPGKGKGAPVLAAASAGSTVTLQGSGTVSDSSTLAYYWVQVDGPTVVLSDPLSAVTTFVVPDLGESDSRQYVFQLFVDDAEDAGQRSEPAVAVVNTGAAPSADTTPPAVALTYGKSRSAVGTGPLEITATFSEPIASTPSIAIDRAGTGNDVTATAMTRTADSRVWRFVYSVAAAGASVLDGITTVTVTGGLDAAGNANGAATNNQFTIDTTAPSVSLSYSKDRTNVGTGAITITATFGEPIVTTPLIAVDRPGVGNDAGPSVMTATSDPRVWTAGYFVLTADRAVILDGVVAVAVSGARDAVGLPNTPAQLATFTVNTLAPGVALTYSKNRSNVGTGPLIITATFTEAIVSTPTISVERPGTGNDVSGAAMTRTADARVWRFVYTVSAASGSGVLDGLVTVSISGGRDADGNSNTPAVNDTFAVSTGTSSPPANQPRTILAQLAPGPNLIGIPVDGSTTGTPLNVPELAQLSGASFIAYDRAGALTPSGWSTYIPGLATDAAPVEPGRAYLLMLPGANAVTLNISGLPWSSAADSRTYAAGLGFVSIPGQPAAGATLGALMTLLDVRFLVTTGPGGDGKNRFHVLMVDSPGAASAITEGQGFLYHRPSNRQATLGSLVR